MSINRREPQLNIFLLRKNQIRKRICLTGCSKNIVANTPYFLA